MKNRIFDFKGASHINLTVFSLRTFIFNFIAIRVLSAEDFRTWFVATGVAFSIVALERTGILEPFLIGKFSYKETKHHTFVLIGLTTPPTFLIFLRFLDIGMPKALLMTLGIELIVLSDLQRYLRFSTSSTVVFKSEIYSLSLLLVLILLLTFSQQQTDFWLIVLFQFFLLPLANLTNLSPWRQIGNSEEELKIQQPENDIKPFIAIAVMSMILTQLCIILFQNFLSTSDLRVLKSIETVLSPFRNIGYQIWTRRLLSRTHRKRKRLSFKNLVFSLSLFLLPQVTALLFFSDSGKLELCLLLFCYQVGFWISNFNFDGRIELMRRKNYIPLFFISFWHLLLSALYLWLKGTSYSIFILVFSYNIGLLINIGFTWLYVFKYQEWR